MLLRMCPHAAIYVLILLYMCPHAVICVLILLCMCPHTGICASYCRYLSSYCYICVIILLLAEKKPILTERHMYTHTYTHTHTHRGESSILRRGFVSLMNLHWDSTEPPFTYTYVINTTYYYCLMLYICVLILLQMCHHTAFRREEAHPHRA